MTKVKISEFLNEFYPHAVMTNQEAPTRNPPANQYGYVLGADGRVATEAYVLARAKSSYPLSWQSYYNRCSRWIGRKVWDCNSMAEGYYKQRTGINIDTKARSNYATWCSVKDISLNDNKLLGLPQKAGVAVFSGNSVSTITHVGYLLFKYGTGDLDWYVVEAKGADYGVIITKLPERNFEWWGIMDKYYDYDCDVNWRPLGAPRPAVPPVVIPPVVTPPVSIESFFAECTGNSVNVRTGRGTSFATLGTINVDQKILALPSVSGWNEVAVEMNNKLIVGYMSDDYVKSI